MGATISGSLGSVIVSPCISVSILSNSSSSEQLAIVDSDNDLKLSGLPGDNF